MEYGIFGQLSAEEAEVAVTGTFDVASDIEAEAAYADALVIGAEMEADVTAMTQAEVAASRLEVQLSSEEVILATPEKVTASAAQLSHESLATTAMLLGAPASMVADFAVSHEAAEANPVSALEVSHEGVSSFLGKVVESIKAIFKKIMNAGKKLFVKLVVAMDGTAKKANALGKVKITGKAKSEKFSEKESKSIAGMFGAGLILDGFSGDTITDAIALKAVSVDDNKTTPTKALLRSMVDAGTAKTQKEAKEILDKVNTFGMDSVELEKISNFQAPDADGDVKVDVVYVVGKTIGCIVKYIKTDDDKTPAIKYVKSKAEVTDLEGKGFKVLDAGAIGKLIAGTEAFAKGLKKHKDEVMKDATDADKFLDKMAKDSSDSKTEYALNKLKAGIATATRDITVAATLGGVLAYAKNGKAMLTYAKMNVSQYGGADM